MRAVITGAFVLAFPIVFVQEAIQIRRRQKPPENVARTYVWMTISVLVGNVTAFVFGVDFPNGHALLDLASPKPFQATYAIA